MSTNPRPGLKTCAEYWASRNGERAEDLAWMAATGEHAVGAAQRLGISYGALEKWAKNNTPELWTVLLARNPRDPHVRSANQNQWTKEAS